MAATVAAQLATLVEAVNQLKDRSEEDRDDRKFYHEKLGRELEAERKAAEAYRSHIQDEIVKIKAGQKEILVRVDTIEPVAKMVTSFRAKLVGASIVLGFIGSVVIWALIYFKDAITKDLLP